MTRSNVSVAVLYNESTRVIKGDRRDLIAEQGVIACAAAIAEALEGAGYRVARVPYRALVEDALRPYPATEWVIFNLGEGLEGRLFEEARVAWAIEAMGYRFTGNPGDAIAISTHKGRAKRRLAAAGVSTPDWWLFRHPAEIDAVADFPFPLIVKPVAEDASQGISGDAVARERRALRRRVERIVVDYRQAALVERFIVGREFNVALWGAPPEQLPLSEIDFSAFGDAYARYVSYAAKWEEESFEYQHTPVTCPANVEPALAGRLADAARRSWDAIGCRGYARVDIRLGEDGVPYVVEVNCNPDISPDAGFYRSAKRAGYSYTDMAVRILEMALKGTW